MRYVITILMILVSEQCFCQTDNKQTFLSRIEAIKKLEFYNNKIVILNDTIDYHDLDFPYWKSNEEYYKDDMVRYKYTLYRAKIDTKGQRPNVKPDIWALVRTPHPYLFLRDTAKLEDLKSLLINEHPYIRTYAFGALSYRGYDKLFAVIIDNLKDSTEILEYTGDSGNSAYPAELMIQYAVGSINEKEKKELKELITTKYQHLNRCLDLLEQK